MRKPFIIALLAALFLTIPLWAQEQPKLNEKQIAVQKQFDIEYQKLQKATNDLIVPFKAQKYDIDEAIRDIQKEADKKFLALKDKFDKLFIEAGKIEEKKDATIKN